MENPPEITKSTMDKRREYIKNRFPCISDCDMCGLRPILRERCRIVEMRPVIIMIMRGMESTNVVMVDVIIDSRKGLLHR